MWVISHHHPSSLLLEADGLDDDPGDGVGVAVGAGPPVLEVAVARLGHVPGDPDGGAPVGHAGREVVDGGHLAEAGQATLVVFTCE